MNSTNIPKFYCPFASEIHPQVESAQQETVDWAVRFRLVENGKSFDRFQREKSAYLAGRTFTQTDLERLSIAADWCSWLFLFDDQCDNADFGRQPDKLREVINHFIKILYEDEKVTLENGTPLEASLSDLWERMKDKMPQNDWKERYRKGVKDYFEALHWEATNRMNQTSPSISEYRSMRVASGAVYTVLDLAEITENLNLTPEVIENKTFHHLYYLANVTSCWSNDVFSYGKEKQHGDVHNLVIALENEKELSFSEAVAEAIACHDEDVTEYIRLEKEIPSFGGEMDQQIEKYLRCLRSWMRGHIDWSIVDTGRFDSQLVT